MRKILITAIISMLALSACGKAYDDPLPDNTAGAVEIAAETGTDEEVTKTEEETEEEILVTIKHHRLMCVSDDGGELANGVYPELVLTQEGRSRYPKLVDTVNVLNEYWSQSIRDDVSAYGAYMEESEYFQDSDPFCSDIECLVTRFDEHMLSIRLNYYDFAGGAHPMHYTRVTNIDPVSGHKLMLEDVLANTADLPAIVRDETYLQYPDLADEISSYTEPLYDDEGDYFVTMMNDNSYTWAIGADGLTIHFSPYEVASYAAGDLDVTLSADKYPDLVKKEYLTTVADPGKVAAVQEPDPVPERLSLPDDPQ